jgi:hypothetical protein
LNFINRGHEQECSSEFTGNQANDQVERFESAAAISRPLDSIVRLILTKGYSDFRAIYNLRSAFIEYGLIIVLPKNWTGGELPLRKAFLRQSKTLAIVHQTLDGVASPRTENKERTTQRVAGKSLTTKGGQTVDAFAKINGLNRDQDPHLRSDLDHER